MADNSGSSAGNAAQAEPAPTRKDNPSDNTVQRTRAWTGLWVVVAGDVAIAAAAVIGIWKTAGSTNSNSPMIAILASAFTAIGTMTTAYFGIKTASNTAQSFAPAVHTAVKNASSASPGGGAKSDDAKGGDSGPGNSPGTAGPPIPKDPQNPTDEEIVARTAEPGDQGQ